MAQVLEYADLELSLTAYLRAGLTGWAARVDRLWPDAAAAVTGYDVVIRDDGGPDEQFTADRLAAVTVLGPEGEHYQTGRCAERAAVLLRATPEDPTVPVVHCAAVRGPYSIDSGGRRPAYYLTADLRVIGKPITI